MQPAVRRRSRQNSTLAALVCAALLITTFVLAEMKPWSRKPTEAGLCADHPPQWREKALRGKIAAATAPAFASKQFSIQPGSHWDDEARHWVVPFRTPDQRAASPNFSALIDCTGAVVVQGGNGA